MKSRSIQHGAGVALTLILASACGSVSLAPPEPPGPIQAAPSPPPETEVIEVETSTDADFVAELPIDDEPDRGVPSAHGVIAPLLAVTGTVATFDLPMREHEHVDFWIDYLSTRGSSHFSKWLARSTRYVPLFWSVLDRYELPRDLIFLSMVESGFSTSAYSWAHAAGPWQFVASTARMYGLRIDFWVDDRRDFEKATDAAARHLRDLYDRYGDWFLAMAAYNAGPGKVNRAIRRYGTEDFWKLAQRRYLRRETKQYVPKILAAARLSKLPHVYGLEDVAYQAPLEWEVVTTTRATSLEAMAAACPGELDVDTIGALNPSLRCGVTPPGETWSIRVPAAVTATCAEALRRAPSREAFVYRYHAVSADDRLAAVARRHRTTAQAILDFNGIEADQFLDFEEIVIPVPKKVAAEVPIRKPPHLAFRPPGYGPQSVRLVRYRVRTGDSLWRISQKFHVSISDLTRWNGLRRSSTLRIGDRLRIYLGGRAARQVAARSAEKSESTARADSRSRSRSNGSASRAPLTPGAEHVVAPGESPWLIADRYGVRVADFLAINGLQPGQVIQPGQKLVLPERREGATASRSGGADGARSSEADDRGGTSRGVRSSGESPEVVAASGLAPEARAAAGGKSHTVEPGESWWSIANQHGVSVERLCQINGLTRQDVLQPGQRLAVPEAAPRRASSEQAPPEGAHRVRPGESLWSIATQHGLTVAQLCALNDIDLDAVLQPGDALRVKP